MGCKHNSNNSNNSNNSGVVEPKKGTNISLKKSTKGRNGKLFAMDELT